MPEHELHNGSTAGTPDPGSLHIVTAFVVADDPAESVHDLNTGYRCLAMRTLIWFLMDTQK